MIIITTIVILIITIFIIIIIIIIQVRQHVEEKVLALQMSLRELQTGVEGLGPLQTGGNDTEDLVTCQKYVFFFNSFFEKKLKPAPKGCHSCERVWARCTRRWRQKSTNDK